MSDPEIKRGAYGGAGKEIQGGPMQGRPTNPSAVSLGDLREQAAKLKIDTQGKSGRELRADIKAVSEAHNAMAEFIRDSMTPPSGSPAKSMDGLPEVPQSRRHVDPPGSLLPNQQQSNQRPGESGSSQIPPAPSSGTHILASVDGSLQWLATSECGTTEQ